MRLNMSSAKWRPFCQGGGDELMPYKALQLTAMNMESKHNVIDYAHYICPNYKHIYTPRHTHNHVSCYSTKTTWSTDSFVN